MKQRILVSVFGIPLILGIVVFAPDWATAVALAGFLKADLCQIYTDVDGVYDRDPRKYPDATKFDRIGYDEMLILARQGAQVLHDRSVELAREHGIKVEVLSAFSDGPGTVVG